MGGFDSHVLPPKCFFARRPICKKIIFQGNQIETNGEAGAIAPAFVCMISPFSDSSTSSASSATATFPASLHLCISTSLHLLLLPLA